MSNAQNVTDLTTKPTVGEPVHEARGRQVAGCSFRRTTIAFSHLVRADVGKGGTVVDRLVGDLPFTSVTDARANEEFPAIGCDLSPGTG